MMQQESQSGPMAVEDVDDLDLGLLVSPLRPGGGGLRREATPPQVIVTNSKKMARKPSKPHREGHHSFNLNGPGTGGEREVVQRGRGHRRKGDRTEPHIPFNTSLDSDFLNLFAY